MTATARLQSDLELRKLRSHKSNDSIDMSVRNSCFSLGRGRVATVVRVWRSPSLIILKAGFPWSNSSHLHSSLTFAHSYSSPIVNALERPDSTVDYIEGWKILRMYKLAVCRLDWRQVWKLYNFTTSSSIDETIAHVHHFSETALSWSRHMTSWGVRAAWVLCLPPGSNASQFLEYCLTIKY